MAPLTLAIAEKEELMRGLSSYDKDIMALNNARDRL